MSRYLYFTATIDGIVNPASGMVVNGYSLHSISNLILTANGSFIVTDINVSIVWRDNSALSIIIGQLSTGKYNLAKALHKFDNNLCFFTLI